MFAQRAAKGIPYVLSINPRLMMRIYVSDQNMPPIIISSVYNFMSPFNHSNCVQTIYYYFYMEKSNKKTGDRRSYYMDLRLIIKKKIKMLRSDPHQICLS